MQWFNRGGTWFKVYGDAHSHMGEELIRLATADLHKLKESNVNRLDSQSLNKRPFYAIQSNFGKDVITVWTEPAEEKRGLKGKILSVEKKGLQYEDYVLAHEVWIMDPGENVGGGLEGPWDNATQVGYLICEGGGFTPPYNFAEAIIKTEDNGDIIRNVIHPLASKAGRARMEEKYSYDALVANGGTAVPFFWNSWKGHRNELAHGWPIGPWGEGTFEEWFDPDEELFEHEGAVYYDHPCFLEESIYKDDHYGPTNRLRLGQPEYEYAEGGIVVSATRSRYLGWHSPGSPTYGSGSDASKYAYYWAYTTDPVLGETFKFGFNVNGAITTIDQYQRYDEWPGVAAMKYFEIGEIPYLVCFTQGWATDWGPEGGVRGPGSWFYTKQGDLGWSMDLELDPAYFSGYPSYSDPYDEWFGGLYGDNVGFHFRRIPDAPKYSYPDGGEEFDLITAGTYRLLKRVVTEEETRKVTEREIVLIPE